MNVEYQLNNLCLSIILAYNWLKHENEILPETLDNGKVSALNIPYAPLFALNEKFLSGINNCVLNGRSQILTPENYPNITGYIDGAHTKESMYQASVWFNDNHNQSSRNVLVFNCKKTKYPEVLLRVLYETLDRIDHIIFCAGKVEYPMDDSNAISNKITGDVSWQEHCRDVWKVINSDEKKHNATTDIKETIYQILEETEINSKQTNLFITGSLYLVGAFLEEIHHEIKYF